MTHKNSTRVKAPAKTPEILVCPKLTHEDTSSKPNGRVVSDYKKKKGLNLLKCKYYTLIGTFNARTLKEDHKRYELANNFIKSNLCILGVIDHKLVHEDEPVRIETLHGSTLITTSAWRTSSGAALGGVGIMVNNRAENLIA